MLYLISVTVSTEGTLSVLSCFVPNVIKHTHVCCALLGAQMTFRFSFFEKKVLPNSRLKQRVTAERVNITLSVRFFKK